MHYSLTSLQRERAESGKRVVRWQGGRVNVVLMSLRLKGKGGGLFAEKQTLNVCHFLKEQNNQVLCLSWVVKQWWHDRSHCEYEQVQVGYFQVLGQWVGDVHPGVHLFVCAWACEGAGSHQGLSNISNVNSDESRCSWEYVCMRVWSMFVRTHALVYFRWSRGPKHHQKTETHHTDMACIILIGLSSCASILYHCTHTFMDVYQLIYLIKWAVHLPDCTT